MLSFELLPNVYITVKFANNSSTGLLSKFLHQTNGIVKIIQIHREEENDITAGNGNHNSGNSAAGFMYHPGVIAARNIFFS